MKGSIIGIAGSGWGFWAALKGLIKNFNSVEIFNPTEKEALIDFFKANNNIHYSIRADIKDFKCEYIICAGFKEIIEKAQLKNYFIVNIHYSLLPNYRGFHSTVWAILNNEKFLGYTIHEINEYIDDGPIIYQYSVENDFQSTSYEYMIRFNTHVEENIGDLILKFINKKIISQPQDKTKASWVGKRNIRDCEIDFAKTIYELKAFFRALSHPYPLPFFKFKEQNIFPRKIKYQESSVQTHIGRILNIDEDGIWIKIKNGYIIFNELVDENGKDFSLANFKIGFKLL